MKKEDIDSLYKGNCFFCSRSNYCETWCETLCWSPAMLKILWDKFKRKICELNKG